MLKNTLIIYLIIYNTFTFTVLFAQNKSKYAIIIDYNISNSNDSQTLEIVKELEKLDFTLDIIDSNDNKLKKLRAFSNYIKTDNTGILYVVSNKEITFIGNYKFLKNVNIDQYRYIQLNSKEFERIIAKYLDEPLKESKTVKPEVKPTSSLVVQNQDSTKRGKSIFKLDLKMILIKGGVFMMGSGGNESPVHRVAVKDFYMSKTEVTVGQYRKCVEAGECSEPHWDDGSCWVYNGSNWETGVLSEEFRRENQPIVCVDWKQARTFAKWVGGDLPSEAQWEYASRSEGKDIEYPWGNAEATCEYAVMNDGGNGCGRDRTWEVCSKTEGNTTQGLCDMGGMCGSGC
jgi:hypothetical protein